MHLVVDWVPCFLGWQGSDLLGIKSTKMTRGALLVTNNTHMHTHNEHSHINHM